MPNALHSRKQELVRETIYNAAIELFVKEGFDETTLEAVAKAAGVSPRTFFRYFATRGDLLAYSIAEYGKELIMAVNECPKQLSLLQTVHHAAVSGIQFSVSQPKLKQIIEISSRYPSARQAQQSGIAGVQSRLSEAFASRIRNASRDDLKPRMLASLTIMVVDLTLLLWFRGDYKDPASASKQVLTQLSRILSEGLD